MGMGIDVVPGLTTSRTSTSSSSSSSRCPTTPTELLHPQPKYRSGVKGVQPQILVHIAENEELDIEEEDWERFDEDLETLRAGDGWEVEGAAGSGGGRGGKRGWEVEEVGWRWR